MPHHPDTTIQAAFDTTQARQVAEEYGGMLRTYLERACDEIDRIRERTAQAAPSASSWMSTPTGSAIRFPFIHAQAADIEHRVDAIRNGLDDLMERVARLEMPTEQRS